MLKDGKTGLYLPSSPTHAGGIKMVYFGGMRVWAEDGMVCTEVEDTSTKRPIRFLALTPDQAEYRMKKVFESAGTRVEFGLVKDSQGRVNLERAAQGVQEICNIAREQAAAIATKTKVSVPVPSDIPNRTMTFKNKQPVEVVQKPSNSKE